MGELKLGPFLWGPRTDLLAFGGSALFALSLVLAGRVFGFGGGDLPAWGWVAFVLLVDVGHVYSTLFRTYFDRGELAQHPIRYFGMPAVLYLTMVALHSLGELLFWRVLAYMALFHFVRQQAGWVALYRARAGQGRLDRWIDNLAIYLATLYPTAYWHAHLQTSHFAWFVNGDFVLISWAGDALPVLALLWAFSLTAFAFRQFWLLRATRSFALGKSVVVATTALTWYVGIVATNSDFDFTVTNVVIHGVPYVVLLWVYSNKHRSRAASEARSPQPQTLTGAILAWGTGAFLGVLVLFAYAEELLWDRLVYHERSWLFVGPELHLDADWLSWVVPLLALPQLTHYALDGMLWRRRDTAQRRKQQLSFGYS